MRKLCSLFLAFCILCSLSVAYADSWKCQSCGSTVSGNFCSNCGSAKPWSVNCPDPGEAFGVSLAAQDEDDGLIYYYFEYPAKYTSTDEINTEYIRRLRSTDISYEVVEESNFIIMDLNGDGDSNAVFGVLDDYLVLVVAADQTSQKTGLPPRMDEVLSNVYRSRDGANDSGTPYNHFEGFFSTGEMTECIEAYIRVLEEYGFTLQFSEVLYDTYYDYYLVSSDTSLEKLGYRGHVCHIAIEGFAYYGTYWVYVMYSPSIQDHYLEGGDDSTSTSSSANFPTSPTTSPIKVRCVKCQGDGKITCTNCDGKGYKIVTSYSTPNYSGSKGGSKKVETKETCFKCHGSGTTTCTRCGGSGVT